MREALVVRKLLQLFSDRRKMSRSVCNGISFDDRCLGASFRMRVRGRRLCRLTLELPRKSDKTGPPLRGKADDRSNLFDQIALELGISEFGGVLHHGDKHVLC